MTGPAAQRWAEQVDAWALPASIDAPFDPPFDAPFDDPLDATAGPGVTATAWARDVLPSRGGTVLDVGCGCGRSSLPLAPPASELIGVDRRGAMLDEYVRAATAAGVARRTVHGEWPAVADITPTADVVVCHHVLYDVADIVPFVLALTDHARLAVVVELPVRHPMTAWSSAWRHVWNLAPPTGPSHVDLVEVLRELGLDPEIAVGPCGSAATSDLEALVRTARRRLRLGPERDADLAAWLRRHPPDWVDEIATLRWPGEARPD